MPRLYVRASDKTKTMRIGSRQLAGSMRIAVLLTACAAFVGTTSGLLLAIHLLCTEHSADHASHDCTICQQLLIFSKKALPAPPAEWVQAAPVLYTDAPSFLEHVKHHCLEASQARGPPCSCPHRSV